MVITITTAGRLRQQVADFGFRVWRVWEIGHLSSRRRGRVRNWVLAPSQESMSLVTPGFNTTSHLLVEKSVWCLVWNGGMDPYSSPYITPNNSLHNPFPHSLRAKGSAGEAKSFDG